MSKEESCCKNCGVYEVQHEPGFSSECSGFEKRAEENQVIISNEDWKIILSDICEIYDWAKADNVWAQQPDMGSPGGRRLIRPSGAKVSESILRLMKLVLKADIDNLNPNG